MKLEFEIMKDPFVIYIPAELHYDNWHMLFEIEDNCMLMNPLIMLIELISELEDSILFPITFNKLVFA